MKSQIRIHRHWLQFKEATSNYCTHNIFRMFFTSMQSMSLIWLNYWFFSSRAACFVLPCYTVLFLSLFCLVFFYFWYFTSSAKLALPQSGVCFALLFCLPPPSSTDCLTWWDHLFHWSSKPKTSKAIFQQQKTQQYHALTPGSTYGERGGAGCQAGVCVQPRGGVQQGGGGAPREGHTGSRQQVTTHFNSNLGGIFYICFSNILGVDCLLYKLCLRCEGNVTKIKKYIMK